MNLCGFGAKEELDLALDLDLELELLGWLELLEELDESEVEGVELEDLELELQLQKSGLGLSSSVWCVQSRDRIARHPAPTPHGGAIPSQIPSGHA